MQRSRLRLLTSLAALMAGFPLAGCGGGDEDGTAPSPSPGTAPAPGTTPAPPPAAVLPARTYAYVLAADGVTPFRIDGNGSMVSGQVHGAGSVALAINPFNQSLYAVEPGTETVDGQITAFRIDADTGALNRIDAYATGPSATSVLGHGTLMFVANSGNASVSTYTCGPGGELLAPRTQGVSTRPGAMAMDQLGGLLCIIHRDQGTIESYTVSAEPTAGTITLADSIGTDSIPEWIAVGSRFVYVSGVSGTLWVHALGNTGGLGIGTQLEPEGGSGPIVFDPESRFAFMANRQDSAVSVFRIDPDTGLLDSQVITALTGTPTSLAVDPTGQALLVTTSDNSLTMFAVDQVTGGLRQLGTTQTGPNPARVGIVSFPE